MIKVVVMVLLVITSPICYHDQIYLSMISVFLWWWWYWWWYKYLYYMLLRHILFTVTFIYHRMVKMLSIMPVSIRNGILRNFSFWRELIPILKIRWVLSNYNFTYPYHLCRYCTMIVIDTAYLYLVVHHIVSYWNEHILDSLC